MEDSWDPRPLREFFQEQMRRKGWNQSELAREIHTAPSVLGRWMSGENRPTTDKLRQVARGLRVDYGQLLERAGYLESKGEPTSRWHADLCAKLERIPLTQQQYELLDATLNVLLDQSAKPLSQKPTG